MNDWKKTLKTIKDQLFTQSSSSQDEKDNTPSLAKSSSADASTREKKAFRSKRENRKDKYRSNTPKKPITKFDSIYNGTAALDAYSSPKKTPTGRTVLRGSPTRDLPPLELDPEQTIELSNSRHFKQPEQWVKAGISLQPEGIRNKKSQVFLGIDFGTSYTKISIRTQDSIFFPDWSGIHNGSSKYLLPSEISEMKNGSYLIGRAKNAIKLHTNLKQSIILEDSNSKETRLALIAYLAWVMRYARAWLFKEQEIRISGKDLIWNINIGCPTNTYDVSSAYKAYEEIGPMAWHLSQSESIDKASAEGSIETQFISREQLESFDYHPEFAAQIAGYVKSPQKRDGLHLLLDAGGGTLDIAIFNVYERSYQVVYPIFSSKVSKLGTHYLMRNRFLALGIASPEWADKNETPDTRKFSCDFNIPIEAAEKADEEFKLRIRKDIVDTAQFARQHKVTPLDWKKISTVIIAGGGASLNVYQRSLESALNQLSLKHQNIELIAPDDAQNLDSTSHYHRLSVAYGLTFEAAEIRRSSEVEDIPQPKQAQRADREELYPR
mgnify:CR=1 FL=1